MIYQLTNPSTTLCWELTSDLMLLVSCNRDQGVLSAQDANFILAVSGKHPYLLEQAHSVSQSVNAFVIFLLQRLDIQLAVGLPLQVGTIMLHELLKRRA